MLPSSSLLPLHALPLLNAFLNSLSAVLLCSGYIAIRRRCVSLHKTCMLTACATSTLFLISYLTYHYHVGSKPFTGPGQHTAGLFHDPDFAHDSGSRDCAPGIAHPDPGLESAMDSPPASGTLDLAALALRLRNRRGHLSHALPALSCLLKSSQNTYGSASKDTKRTPSQVKRASMDCVPCRRRKTRMGGLPG